MKFRTEIEPMVGHCAITHNDNIIMLGSCFTDNIGNKLEKEGFNVVHNPFGTLYNPASIANCINRTISGEPYSVADLDKDNDLWHCLDFASVYCSKDSEILIEKLNNQMAELRTRFFESSRVIITFGTSWVFEKTGTNKIVGNCHKFKPSFFDRRCMSVCEIVALWQPIIEKLKGKKCIFTVSPIRHTADGLHGNTISKSTLLLAVDELCNTYDNCQYFPAFEIMNDDLRDYRFYASDMKHPSDVAIDYIYDYFSNIYFNNETQCRAVQCRKESLRAAHRQIIIEQ